MADAQPRLERRVRRDFPDRGSAGTVLRQLAELPRRAGYDPDVLASERVQAAIVLLAHGDVLRLRQALDLAMSDWRDVLTAAGLADEDWSARLDRELGPDIAANESDRSEAILAFLVGDLADRPSKASLVTLLGNAYRAVAALRQAGEVDTWLAGERRWQGMRERAAIVAVLDSSAIDRANLAESYCADHPAHAAALAQLLDHLQE